MLPQELFIGTLWCCFSKLIKHIDMRFETWKYHIIVLLVLKLLLRSTNNSTDFSIHLPYRFVHLPEESSLFLKLIMNWFKIEKNA